MIAILVQVLAIPSVMALFHFAPRWLASLSASFVFVIVSVVSIHFFYKLKAFRSYSLWLWAGFLYILVIPILAMRLTAGIYYEGSIQDIYPTLSLLHKISNPYYIVALIASIVECLQNKKAAI